MPSSFRPYYPRRMAAAQQSNDWERGEQAGAQIGKLLGGLGTAITGAQKQAQQDKVANQLLAQNYPDQPGGTDPDPDPIDAQGNPITDPNTPIPDVQLPAVKGNFQGGLAELRLRQEAAKSDLSMQDLQAQIAQRKAAALLSGTRGTGKTGLTVGGGSSSRWLQSGDGAQNPRTGGRTAKPVPYAGGTGDVENDEETDNFDQIRTDFDQQHGKGTFDAFQAESGGTKNDDGSYSITDKSGKPIATVQGSDVPLWMQRVNAARVKRGQSAIGSIGTGQNPTSSAAPGTATNPVVAQSKLHVRSLPFGTYVYDPNTQQTFIKQKPSGQ